MTERSTHKTLLVLKKRKAGSNHSSLIVTMLRAMTCVLCFSRPEDSRVRGVGYCLHLDRSGRQLSGLSQTSIIVRRGAGRDPDTESTASIYIEFRAVKR